MKRKLFYLRLAVATAVLLMGGSIADLVAQDTIKLERKDFLVKQHKDLMRLIDDLTAQATVSDRVGQALREGNDGSPEKRAQIIMISLVGEKDRAALIAATEAVRERYTWNLSRSIALQNLETKRFQDMASRTGSKVAALADDLIALEEALAKKSDDEDLALARHQKGRELEALCLKQNEEKTYAEMFTRHATLNRQHMSAATKLKATLDLEARLGALRVERTLAANDVESTNLLDEKLDGERQSLNKILSFMKTTPPQEHGMSVKPFMPPDGTKMQTPAVPNGAKAADTSSLAEDAIKAARERAGKGKAVKTPKSKMTEIP